ncbi:HEBP2 isoform 4, partial [Pan troglodytes]
MKIKMTAPVTSYVEPGSGPFREGKRGNVQVKIESGKGASTGALV